MNDLRTFAQQALEALEDMLGWQSLAPQTIQEAAKGRAAALKAALAEPVQDHLPDITKMVQEPGVWTPVTDALPQSGVKVLACYRNRLGNLRRIRAMWTAAKTEEADSEDAEACSEYDEATDTYYVTEGWYECIDNWGDYSSVAVTEGEVTHWMPLPPDPDSAPPQRPAEPVQEPVAWRYSTLGTWIYVDVDPNLWQDKPEGKVQALYLQQTTVSLSEEKNGAMLSEDSTTK